MKRFHVHVSVHDLKESIGFYSQLFGSTPSVEKPDYAKWMLDDPRINFAISQRGHAVGVNHLGFQVDSDEELKALRGQVDEAGLTSIEQTGTNCCYAKSDKHWLEDPQGIAWETFHTLASVPVFGEENVPDQSQSSAQNNACCAPTPIKSPEQNSSACCGPSVASKSVNQSYCG